MKRAIATAGALLCVGSALLGVATSVGRGAAGAANDPDLNEQAATYVCCRAIGDIVIDGDLSEESWLKAASTGNFSLHTGKQESPLHTSAKMLWDDKTLYVGFVCEDQDIWATLRDRDDPLWIQDVVEVFIMEQSVGQGHYLEYEFSPRGTLFDSYVVKPFVGIPEWESPGLQAAGRIAGKLKDSTHGDSGYTVEIAIPFVGLYLEPVVRKAWIEPEGLGTKGAFAGRYLGKQNNCIPKDGSTIRLNLYRIDYPTPENLGGKGGPPTYITWSPTISKSFHAPERFGTVRFVRLPVGQPMPEASRLNAD